MARVEFLAGANEDFDESFDWYAKRSAAAAIGFASAVDEAIEKIVADPNRFPSAKSGCRYCNLHPYPFRLVFRAESERLVVVAIAHAKRRPHYWRGRF
ncbi:MAG: type II toxin-antitoxin system RelE/ParE family toxin [Planctomycetia bacterium]|nr:type II toxin-antitoxin system RelE/ParE family toxin [Planctomycetia bacterium]